MKASALAALVAFGCAGDETASRAPELPGSSGLASLAWLSGVHRMTDGDAVIEEHWTHPGGSVMFGINRTMKGEALAAFEILRIEARPDAIVYVAQPGGRVPGTEFTLVPQGDPDTFTFENPEHDFPQRIHYRRVDATHVHIRAENDTQALTFDLLRAD